MNKAALLGLALAAVMLSAARAAASAVAIGHGEHFPVDVYGARSGGVGQSTGAPDLF